MKTKLCLFLVVFLLIPSVSFAVSTVDVQGVVWEFDETGESKVAPKARVQIICEPSGFSDEDEADDDGLFELRPPAEACQIRVILPGKKPSSVESVYFGDDNPNVQLELILEYDAERRQWYLDAQVS